MKRGSYKRFGEQVRIAIAESGDVNLFPGLKTQNRQLIIGLNMDVKSRMKPYLSNDSVLTD